MTIHSLTLTNPGAESGNTTGWTLKSGGTGFSATASLNSKTPHTGSFLFDGGVSTNWYQQVDVTAYATAIDGNTAAFKATAWKQQTRSSQQQPGAMYLECYASDGTTLLLSETTSFTNPTTWTQELLLDVIPIGTRYLRIGTINNANAFGDGMAWDDFALELGDAATTDYPVTLKAQQIATYGLVSQPAAQIQSEQMAILSVQAAQTSTAAYPMRVDQVVAYALVKSYGDQRRLRAWWFPQDDHRFYVLQLGNNLGTLIFDPKSQQWAQWQSPNYTFWRGADGCAWIAAGINVACDTITGKVWQIDPQGRLDYNDTTLTNITPITSVVVGGTSKRFRSNVPCYMAELAISEALPPDGIDPTTVGISLRSGDTITWNDHGTVQAVNNTDKLTVRWYGLGLMSYPGRVFEITDTGYARRIDGFNIELGNTQNGN